MQNKLCLSMRSVSAYVMYPLHCLLECSAESWSSQIAAHWGGTGGMCNPITGLKELELLEHIEGVDKEGFPRVYPVALFFKSSQLRHFVF